MGTADGKREMSRTSLQLGGNDEQKIIVYSIGLLSNWSIFRNYSLYPGCRNRKKELAVRSDFQTRENHSDPTSHFFYSQQSTATFLRSPAKKERTPTFITNLPRRKLFYPFYLQS